MNDPKRLIPTARSRTLAAGSLPPFICFKVHLLVGAPESSLSLRT